MATVSALGGAGMATEAEREFSMGNGRYAAFLLSFIVLLLYARTIFFGYFNDDFFLVNLSFEEAFMHSFRGMHFRPLWYFSYPITNFFFQSSVLDHTVNILLYALSSVLGFGVARIYLASRTRAFALTLIWVFVPWNLFPAAWISQRNDLLVFCFTFSALIMLHKGKHGAALANITCSVLSKVSAIFMPVYFVYYTLARKRIVYSLLFTIVFITYVILALRAVNLYYDGTGSEFHDAGLAVKLAGYTYHWTESLLLQFVPIPFFASVVHGLVYAGGLILVIASAGVAVEKVNIELVLLFLCSCGASLVTSDMRTLGLETFFLLLLVFSHLKFEPRKGLIGTIVIVACYLVSINITLPSLNTGFTDPSIERDSPWPEYLDRYYRIKKELLQNLVDRVQSFSLP